LYHERSGLDAGERSRVEAERRQLEAQAEAAMAMQRKIMQRVEAERQQWMEEKDALTKELSGQREAMLAVQRESRQLQLEGKKLTSELGEAKAESKRLKAERESLMEQLRSPGSADSDDALALQQDLEGQLEQSREHARVVSRKMTKAHKQQQNLLDQFQAEIELLADKVDQLEDECCQTEQDKLRVEEELRETEESCLEMRRELDRQAARQYIQPVGMQELLDQLEMANQVKDTLCNEIAVRNEELATAKLEHVQVQADLEEMSHRLRRAEEKRQRYLMMSRLFTLQSPSTSVQIADWTLTGSHPIYIQVKFNGAGIIPT